MVPISAPRRDQPENPLDAPYSNNIVVSDDEDYGLDGSGVGSGDELDGESGEITTVFPEDYPSELLCLLVKINL